jgi:hypothetical protein
MAGALMQSTRLRKYATLALLTPPSQRRQANMSFKCANCGADIKKKHGLCDDCKQAAAELDRRVQRKTEEEILRELETKPRSWRDMFRVPR